MEEKLLITNISHVTVRLANGNTLRLHVGAISLENQLANYKGGKDYPMIAGWNENPAVRFADFQLWLNCKVEESEFINSKSERFPIEKEMFVSGSAVKSEFVTSLEFKDGTRLDFTTRDKKRPIEVSVWQPGTGNLQSAIAKYGYTQFDD